MQKTENKIVSVKTYTIETTEYTDGRCDTKRISNGFNTLETVGLLKIALEGLLNNIYGGTKTTLIKQNSKLTTPKR